MSGYRRANMGSYGGGYSDDDISRFLAPYMQQQQRQQQQFRPGPFDSSLEPAAKRLKREETKQEKEQREALEIQAPPQSMTGVSESVTRICAKLSHGIYKANSKQGLNGLSTDGVDVEVILFDDHGILKTTTPPFGVAILPELKTMVLVWRGSMTKVDWVLDMAVAPVASSRWKNAAKNLRGHAGYTALVESDLALHEDYLIAEIQKRGISQVILTGHSLAGAMAQISQVAIQGQLSQEGSPWNCLQDKQLMIRSIQFGAPMTCMLLDEDDKGSSDFWSKVSATSCNLVFASDMLPRAPGNFRYVDDAIRTALVPFVKDAFKDVPIMSMLDLFPSAYQKLVDLYQDETKKQDIIDIVKVCIKYQHVGSIVWYESVQASPIKLNDYQFRTHDKYQYSIPSDTPFPNRTLKQHHVKVPALLAHDTPAKK
mmetsp:Transcript_8116/g.17559  ORF Transcript_8116/g.17559 Transcript_8116/m.17559 type:complete len:427 (+) Transcript_8116:139-1419(+)